MQHLKTIKGRLSYLCIFILCFAVIAVSFCGFFHQNYNHDLITTVKYDGSIRLSPECLTGGRPVGCILRIPYDAILYRLGIGYFRHQWVTELFTMILYGFDATLLYIFLLQKGDPLKIRVICLSGILIGFVNPGILEVFSFYGPDIAFAILFVGIALHLFKKSKYILSGLVLYLAVSCYQVYYAVFFIFCIAYLFIRKEKVKRFVYVVMITAASVILNLAVTKISALIFSVGEVKPTSIPISKDLLDRIWMIIRIYGSFLKDSYGYIPKGLLLLLVALLFISAIVVMLRKKQYKIFGQYIVLCVFLFLSPIVYGFVMDSFYYPLRATVPVFFAVGVFIIMTSVFLSNNLKDGKYCLLEFLPHVETMILAVLLFCSVEWGTTDILTMNKVETQTCRYVEKYIEKYEKENKTKINTVKVTHYPGTVINAVNTYSIIKYTGSETSAAMLDTAWSDVKFLNYITGKNYEKEEMTKEEAQRLFGAYDANTSLVYFNEDEQLVIEGDTLYWLLYGV